MNPMNPSGDSPSSYESYASYESDESLWRQPDVEKFRHSFQLRLPKCGVVMPVKGVHGQSYANWRAQITSMYGGQLEFFFAVESEDDPAYSQCASLLPAYSHTPSIVSA